MNQEYQNILVPVDGSKQAERALNKAIAVAKRNDAHIDILNVIDTRAMAYNFAGMSDSSIAYQLVDKSKDYLDELYDNAKQKQGFDNIDIHIRLGNPKTVISFDFPRDHQNDLIMMGASGLTRLQRAMVGSVTSFVKRNAPVDVLVVRTDLNNEVPADDKDAKKK
ncbi:universal stress protein [Limosilactobacillus mucosae]|uniref:universal stress protein n=1 Tax=Limosilactobacillus TaxID=2742598 RepID=UPI00233EA147|nr:MULTISPECIES: universal stress protein [Limosilactobacillus]MDC2839445.1 universal stress protein [Limosilactobacillus mucosae]MDC2841313.1 universal stress protein [Limosilactobacillus mucosae]MDC2845213.1 universal stress protein [Limosilactobacillus mucosae]MDM8219155.1 universal stress protein [Limosilactobacillus mucosae]MDM8313811.1 universal stress protein [Limosilactobacillus mucosae]